MTLFSALIIISIGARSQSVSSSVINCSGNSYSHGYYNVDWSIGELALVNTIQSNGYAIITNGFLQPNLADYNNDSRRYFTNEEVTRMSPVVIVDARADSHGDASCRARKSLKRK